jgi:hypothetical protein
MNWITELYVAKLKSNIPEYSKSLELDRIKDFLEISPYGKSYDDYVKPGLLYFTENLNTLARELNVNKIYPMGLYIRGIYGGEEKKHEEKYAGLILEEYQQDDASITFKLHNTRDKLVLPKDLLKEYNIKVYKVVYEGEVNPFKLKKCLNIILSQNDEISLKRFLQKALEWNISRISRDTFKKVEKLINELKQPSNITSLDINKYYVMYRLDRAFTAFSFKPINDNIIIHSTISYIECKNENVSYYYAAILNYLAFKVVESRRSFIRHQYARPLLAIYIAGLSWNDIDGETRKKIIELSKTLHERALDKEYGNQKVALKAIAQFPEFEELVRVLDSKTDKDKLEEALNMVSGKGVEV